jgi:polysaccharide biosynthesis protein PslJ
MEPTRWLRFPRLTRPLALAAGTILVVAVGLTVGAVATGYESLGLPLALGILVLGLAFVDLSIVPALALPATLIVERVAGVLSGSDLVLVGATCVALVMLRGRGATALQPLLWSGVVYLALAIPTLILNRYAANLVEWLHEVVLVLGSMVVGFVVGREGKAKLALSIYIVACLVMGVAAVVVALVTFEQTGMFLPVYLGGLHKNLIGGALAVAVVMLFARPPWLGWSGRMAYLCALVCALGVLATQSRQGLVAMMVGVLIITLRPIALGHRRGRLLWLLYVPGAAFVVIQLQDQLASGDEFNSAYQRLTWFTQSIEIWQSSPIFGVGLRWWYTTRFAESFQPPNAELEVLTTVGVVGLIGFLLMFGAASWGLSRLDPVYGTIGLAVIATRFVQAQFDLYWVAGQASLLWIVAGICYGVMVRDRETAASPHSGPGAALTSLTPASRHPRPLRANA